MFKTLTMNSRSNYTLLLVVFVLASTTCSVYADSNDNLSTSYLKADGSEDGTEDNFLEKMKYWECRRNPTWKTGGVDYKECQRLTKWEGWSPRQKWVFNISARFKHGEDEKLETCLDDRFSDAIERTNFIRCTENTTDAHECSMTEMSVGTKYKHLEDGELAVVRNVFTLQEAMALNALSECVKDILGGSKMYFQEREFRSGGNFVTFLSGLLQVYLPGNTAAIYNAFATAHEHLGWGRHQDIPPPKDLGIRTAEFLEYHTNGHLGIHADGGSHYSISVAMEEPRSYEGGYFHLRTLEGIFKAPRLSAIVFRSLDLHGVTPIKEGKRKAFVLELWDNDDLPAGYGRPNHERFGRLKQILESKSK